MTGGSVDSSEGLSRRFIVAVALTLTVGLLALGFVAYSVTRPCWPWQETGSTAGGTTCDGKPARFDTD